MNLKFDFSSDLVRSIFQKGVMTALIAIMVPTSIAVAEPSLGSKGSLAAQDIAVVNSKSTLDRFTGRTITVEASMYTTAVGETDSSPCISANGSNICDPANQNTIAANGLAFGTKVIFPALGQKVWVVRDRMNARYGQANVDLLAPSKAQAFLFGRRHLTAIVLD